MRHWLQMLLLGWMAVACATTSLPPVTKNFIPEEDEKRLWLRSEEEQRVLNRSGLIYKDEELEAYLNGLLAGYTLKRPVTRFLLRFSSSRTPSSTHSPFQTESSMSIPEFWRAWTTRLNWQPFWATK